MTWKSKYATYEDCEFRTGRYGNGNLALQVESPAEGLICTCSVNPDVPLPDNELAVKDWSENEGSVSHCKYCYITDVNYFGVTLPLQERVRAFAHFDKWSVLRLDAVRVNGKWKAFDNGIFPSSYPFAEMEQKFEACLEKKQKKGGAE